VRPVVFPIRLAFRAKLAFTAGGGDDGGDGARFSGEKKVLFLSFLSLLSSLLRGKPKPLLGRTCLLVN